MKWTNHHSASSSPSKICNDCKKAPPPPRVTARGVPPAHSLSRQGEGGYHPFQVRAGVCLILSKGVPLFFQGYPIPMERTRDQRPGCTLSPRKDQGPEGISCPPPKKDQGPREGTWGQTLGGTPSSPEARGYPQKKTKDLAAETRGYPLPQKGPGPMNQGKALGPKTMGHPP